MSISLKHIYKNFGSFVALNDVSLNIESGELVALLGPSGSGKTTLLRIIAGLEFADKGEVILEGEEKTSKHVKERGVGFMFQHYALFKHMTVFENVAFGLRVLHRKNRPSDQEIQKKVLHLLDLVHLSGLQERYPSQLSGGQRQRVALARALAVQPKVLLLDEPFGALDAKVRKELRRFMRQLHDEIHVTTIFVTHDQEEAMEVADRIVVMNQGHIEQIGSPNEVWNKPKNSFVYDFLGQHNEFDGWQDKEGKIHFIGDHPSEKCHDGKLVKVLSRPHQMNVTRIQVTPESLRVKVSHINQTGPLIKLELEHPNGNIIQAEITFDMMEELQLQKEDEVFVHPKQIKIFD